eukprot:2826051-Rhodomonas_salina.4
MLEPQLASETHAGRMGWAVGASHAASAVSRGVESCCSALEEGEGKGVTAGVGHSDRALLGLGACAGETEAGLPQS